MILSLLAERELNRQVAEFAKDFRADAARKSFSLNFRGDSGTIGSMKFIFQRGKPRVRHLESERTDGSDWLRVTPQKRIEALEFLRADFMGPHYATQRISRFLGITRQT